MDKIQQVIEFKNLPEPIKNWLSSGQATNLVYEINRGLGTQGENRRVIPTLILRLCVGDLAPDNFAKELAEKLNLDSAKTQSTLQEIEQKILQPVASSLFAGGIDVKLIYAAEAPKPATAIQPPSTMTPPLRVPSAPLAPPRPTPPPPIIMKVPINVPKQSPIVERVENKMNKP